MGRLVVYRRAVRRLIPVLLCVALIWACTPRDRDGRPSGGIGTAEGRVTAIDLSEMAVDGPGLVRVEPDDGNAVDVLISACEGPCSLQANELILTLRVGDRVRVRGDESDGKLVLYDDEIHFIELLQ